MEFTRFDEILPKNRKTEKGNKRTGDVAACDWSVPIRVDRSCGLIDLIKTDGPDLPVPIRVLKRMWPSDLDLTDLDLGFTVPAAGVAPVIQNVAATRTARRVPTKRKGGGRGFRYQRRQGVGAGSVA